MDYINFVSNYKVFLGKICIQYQHRESIEHKKLFYCMNLGVNICNVPIVCSCVTSHSIPQFDSSGNCSERDIT